ncbi:DUF3349 domain-containing protein [Nostoc punctiforme]|uniref:Uncharacterized protein n=1 Tax=Nostoc punctiforme (strain ATCC 29133 / PCC 73102) TaxID=63737 RepID=B2J6L6_NOSP7|nr:DUF3349 domain-containing protein [Nostoc punctiforme]ACC82421.1 hypothetical protein Npun_F4042 [Nostoc punctiforme PCC 73102]
MIQCGFPQGIDDRGYLPLLSILYTNMSDRSLAQVVAEYAGKDYHILLNDVYRVGSMTSFSNEVIDSVKQKLISCNYEKWLADE